MVGVVAKVDGALRHFGARRGVILTAGGFINNKAMVERYAPLLRKCRFRAASDGDDGRGIRMGMGAGGAAIRMDVGCIVLPFTVPKGLLRGIFVNRRGQRFVAEDLYQTVVGERALLGENGEVFLILDDAIFERPFPPTELAAVEDTIADLERALGCPPGSLQHTVAVLQRARRARRGSALPQGRRPPRAAREAAVRGARLPHRGRALHRLHARRPAHATSTAECSRPTATSSPASMPPAARRRGSRRRATAAASRSPTRRSSAAAPGAPRPPRRRRLTQDSGARAKPETPSRRLATATLGSVKVNGTWKIQSGPTRK